MAKQEMLRNHIFLKNRITELGIKQWWLAEQVGVDRKTVIRWIQGQVRSIQIENAEKLAAVLNCLLEDLKVTTKGTFRKDKMVWMHGEINSNSE